MELSDHPVEEMVAVPSWFAESRDQSYRHGLQELAARAGCQIELRGHEAVLVSEYSEELICVFLDLDQPWYEISTATMARHPEFFQPRRYYNP
ncbi:MAG: hypothetical protein P4M10_03520 [Verrucomicrobiae bacterium]|nr:hypothetical protein [Verrucomicrobiae bacterium]